MVRFVFNVPYRSSFQWLTRRQAHLLRAQQGIPISEYGVKILKHLFVLPNRFSKPCVILMSLVSRTVKDFS